MENCIFTIGREGSLCLYDKTLSKQHAEVEINNGEIYLRDLKSSNGTYLVKNGRMVRFIEGYVKLSQIIAIGSRQYSIQEILQMAGIKDEDETDGTHFLDNSRRLLHISHPQHKPSPSTLIGLSSLV